MSMRCETPERRGGQAKGFQLVSGTLRLSWLAEAGSGRCGFDGFGEHEAEGPPLTGPMVLRIGAAGLVEDGAARLDLRSLTIRGAQPAAGPPGDGAAMVLGDETATARLARSQDPLTAMEARRALGLPLAPLSGRALDALHILLRLAPERWLPRAQEALGAALPEVLVKAWGMSLASMDPWALERLDHPALRGLPLSSPEAGHIASLQAERLLQTGRYNEAERQLGPLRDADLPQAWRLTADLRMRQGREDEALEALQRWLRGTDHLDMRLDVALRSPRWVALLERAGVTPTYVD